MRNQVSQFPRRRGFLFVFCHTRLAVRAMSEKLERRFAAFAGVPFHDRLHLQQWEQLLAKESWLSHERMSLSGSPRPSVTLAVRVPGRLDDQHRPMGLYELRLRRQNRELIHD
jgi:hypothetical protein